MKNIIAICAAILMTASLWAQSPDKMSYQAVVRDGNNALVTSTAVGMQISILQGSANGTAVYVETQTPTSNANGLVSLEIGSGTVVSGTFAAIDWANGPYFIKTETDPTGGTIYTVSGTNQLLSVPYALYAETSGSSTPGPQGPAGNDGATGPQGPAGANGTSISSSFVQNDSLFIVLSNGQTIGVGSVVGPQGVQGPQGATGPQGPIGPIGPQGVQGSTGATGATGPQGPIGLTGPTGPQGAQGPAGTNGQNGVSITNSYVQGDSLYVTLSNGQTLNTGYVRGPQGITNPIAANITALDTVRWNAAGNDWKLNGNAGTNPTSDFIGTYDNQDLVIKTNNTEKIRIKTDGNVGIGTMNPSWKLSIVDTLPSSSSKTMLLNVESGNQIDSIYRGIDARINGIAGSNRAIEGVSNGANSQRNYGVLGSGSNAVDNRGVYGKSYLPNTNTNGFNYGITGVALESEFSNIAVGAYAEEGNTTTGDNFGIATKATSTTSGTNYGIYSVASNGGTNYAGFFNGDVTITGTLTNPSDRKLKSNIKHLDNVMPLIRELKPVEYDYKKEFSGKSLNLPQNHQYGFIAQEVQTILPELVSNQRINLGKVGGGCIDGDKDKMKNQLDESIEFIGVNYISIIPILVQGIKEQDAKINELESLIIELQKEVEQLKKQ